MPYIGRSTDGFGVRNRFLYLASANDTSVSGADANGATLTFTDGAYVDVYLNGVLLKTGTDYNTNTANTIASLSAMSANDEVTVIVYDVFTVGDMVSATSGGTFSGNVNFSGNIDVDGTANLDAVDIDGAVDMASTLAVGGAVTVTTGSSGASANSVVDDLVVQGSGRSGISILTPDANDGQLVFGSPSDNIGAFISYKHSTARMDVGTSLSGASLHLVSGDGSTAMTLDGNRYVTKPNQPSISVDGNSSSVITDSGSSSYLLNHWTTSNDASFYSQGITYDSSNGRFTVPVAGKYLINVSIYTYQNNVFQRVQLYINGSNNLHFSMDNKTGDGDLGQDNSLSGSTIFNLSANDYIQVYMYKVGSESNKRYYMGPGHSSFSMHLLS